MSAEPPVSPPPGPGGAPFPVEPIHPDLLAWARQTFDLEAFEAEILKYRAGGALRLEDFIDQIEARALGK